MNSQNTYKSFKEFWPFYLEQHMHLVNRRLHFAGTLIIHIIIFSALISNHLKIIWTCPILGYGFAWLGHYIFEKNRPATFTYPIWSLWGDFKMFYMILFNKL